MQSVRIRLVHVRDRRQTSITSIVTGLLATKPPIGTSIKSVTEPKWLNRQVNTSSTGIMRILRDTKPFASNIRDRRSVSIAKIDCLMEQHRKVAER